MEIRSYVPHITLIVLFIITAFALAFTVDVKLSDRAGVTMELPPTIDNWTGDELRYSHDPDNPKQFRVSELEFDNIDPETGEKLHTMSYAEYEALPHDTLFCKSIYTNTAAEQVFVSIVLSGKERSSIHRPQRCLVGQGSTIIGSEVFEIPIEGRKPLKVDILKTQRRYRGADGEVKTYYGYYAYWFVGQGRETHSHYERMFWLAWDRVVHSVAHKWAYIAVSGQRTGEDDENYKTVLTGFVEKLYPHLLVDLSNEG